MKDKSAITLRRDKKGALKFKGERIGSAKRNQDIPQEDDGESKSYEISARLFKTAGGKYVLGVEVYNHTDEGYEYRNGFASESLDALAENAREDSWLDDDILGELFEDTEISEKFVEHIE
jgi:hypothetical protein